jgi:hypothetical protein
MKRSFVSHTGNLIPWKKGGQEWLEALIACNRGSSSVGLAHLPSWEGGSICHTHLFPAVLHGVLQGLGLGLGPEVMEQMVPPGAQDVCCMLGQA